MEKVGIMGYGRFGKVLEKILSHSFTVIIYDPAIKGSKLDEILQLETVFIATPIHKFESVIKDIAPKLSNKTTLIDVCSVKLYPVEIMKKYLPKHIGIIATHPMFGPDSIDSKVKLNLVMYKVRDTQNCYEKWNNFFAKKFNIIELTPDEHDRLAANSQGVVHLVARILEGFGVKPTPIDTQGFKHLMAIVKSNCKDTWDLFTDLQTYNPHIKDMTKKLEDSYHRITLKLEKDDG